MNGPRNSAHPTDPKKANDQLIKTDLTHEEPSSAAEIDIILTRKVRLTYHYSDRARSRTFLTLILGLTCLILIVLPGIFTWFIKPTSTIVSSIFFVPIALSLPYIFYLIYRLSIQGTQASAEASGTKVRKLQINLAREGKELAGWGGALAAIATAVSVIIEFIHF
jgi:hypothetical protein